MELTLSRKSIASVMLALLAIAALAWLFVFGGLHTVTTLFAKATPQAIAPDAAAAADGVSAFYTLSTQEGIDGWTARVCAVSTESGCTITKGFLSGSMNALLEKGVGTAATVQTIKVVDGSDTTRVWELTVTLDQPWEGFENPQTVFALVKKEGEVWKFERLLFSQEAARYITLPDTATP